MFVECFRGGVRVMGGRATREKLQGRRRRLRASPFPLGICDGARHTLREGI